MIKKLFREAQAKPSIIFFGDFPPKFRIQILNFADEIDSLCRGRSDNEDEQTRRIKTELLKQMDGLESKNSGKVNCVILAATNRPWELDNAFLRR